MFLILLIEDVMDDASSRDEDIDLMEEFIIDQDTKKIK